MGTTGIGLSLGTVAVVGGIILAAGAIYYLSTQKKQQKKKVINDLLTDNDRYDAEKSIIEQAINEKDWETLELMLDSSTRDFPDLIEMINKTLTSKNND